MKPIEVELIQDGMAAIKGIAAGTRVVVEGVQNVRKDSVVVEGGAARGGAQGGAGKAAAKDAAKPDAAKR